MSKPKTYCPRCEGHTLQLTSPPNQVWTCPCGYSSDGNTCVCSKFWNDAVNPVARGLTVCMFCVVWFRVRKAFEVKGDNSLKLAREALCELYMDMDVAEVDADMATSLMWHLDDIGRLMQQRKELKQGREFCAGIGHGCDDNGQDPP